MAKGSDADRIGPTLPEPTADHRAGPRERWPMAVAMVAVMAAVVVMVGFLAMSTTMRGVRRSSMSDEDRTAALRGNLGLCEAPRRLGILDVRSQQGILIFNIARLKPGADPRDAVRALAEFGSKIAGLYDPDTTVELRSGNRLAYRMTGLSLGELGDHWKLGVDPLDHWQAGLIGGDGVRPFPIDDRVPTPKEIDEALKVWPGTP